MGARVVEDKGYFNTEVFISGFDDEQVTRVRFSEGYLNLYHNPAYVAAGKEWRQHISVAVNKTLIGSNSNIFGSNPSFWAAQLSTAFFKNLGVAENLYDLPGSFSHESAKCVFWSGAVPEGFQTLFLEGK